MKVIKGEHYPWTRVGYRKPVPRGEVPPPFFTEDGTMVVRFDAAPVWATAAERAAKRATVPAWKFHGYPIRITEDTQFLSCNFSQEKPHTPIFDVAPGVLLIFGDPAEADPRVPAKNGCTLINVTVPDGAETYRCNTGHFTLGKHVTKGHGTPFPHECEKCATYLKVIREEIKAGRYHGQGHLYKEPARARRGKAAGAADLGEIRAENDALRTV